MSCEKKCHHLSGYHDLPVSHNHHKHPGDVQQGALHYIWTVLRFDALRHSVEKRRKKQAPVCGGMSVETFLRDALCVLNAFLSINPIKS